MIITIDGPAASGKSSVARALAERLNLYYLYTGLLYRAIAYILTRQYGNDFLKACINPFKIDPQDLTLIDALEYTYQDGKPHLIYKGQDITQHLYSQEMDQFSSVVSANKEVRERLLALQRSIGERYDIIADGRDCGTVVFPHADIKFFLTADVNIRAERLMHDKKRAGKHENFEHIKQELEQRDHRDQNREVAPLRVPEDAIVIDNSGMTKEETIEQFLVEIEKKQK